MNGVAKKRKLEKLRSQRVNRERLDAVRTGNAPGRGGLWRVAAILAVKRPPGRGRQLSVRVRWVGRGWRDDWVNVTQLNDAAKRDARRMEARLYGLPAGSRAQERPAPTRVQPKRGAGSMEGAEEEEVVMRPPRRKRRTLAVVDDGDSGTDDEDHGIWRPLRRRGGRHNVVIRDGDDDE